MARRVVLTGAASGIGLVMAKRFSDLGDQVALCDSSPAHLAAAQEALPNAITALADVTDEDQMQHFFAQVTERFAGVDIFISNAGTGGPAGPLDLRDDARAGRGRDLVYVVKFWAAWRPHAQPLCGGKMGLDWPNQNIGDGAWPQRRAGKCDLPRRGGGRSHAACA